MHVDVIVPIVEGQAEVESIPVLLRRLLTEWKCYNVEVGKPFRVKRNRVVKAGELERAVALARQRPGCAAILLILDADDDCPKYLGPELKKRLDAVARGLRVGVVLPRAELEAWFLASVESLRGKRGISQRAEGPCDPEEIRDAKGRLANLMDRGYTYVETDDQPALMSLFDFKMANERCRSFRKLLKELSLLAKCTPDLRETQLSESYP